MQGSEGKEKKSVPRIFLITWHVTMFSVNRTRTQHSADARPGAYLGGGHWNMAPPLGCQNSIISIEKYAKLWHGPLFVTWAEGLSTKTVGENLFLAKNRTKFE